MSIAFTNQTSVTVPNPFAPGPVEAVVKDQDGVRLWCGEDYSDTNVVTVAFDRAMTGTIDLIGDSGAGGGLPARRSSSQGRVEVMNAPGEVEALSLPGEVEVLSRTGSPEVVSF